MLKLLKLNNNNNNYTNNKKIQHKYYIFSYVVFKSISLYIEYRISTTLFMYIDKARSSVCIYTRQCWINDLI